MTQLSPNLGLKEWDLPTDDAVSVETFIEDLAGYSATSNMNKIDTFAGETTNSITDLKGAGYTNQTVRGNYDLILAQSQRLTYTASVTGTNSLTGTISELTSIQNNITMKIIPSVANTGAVTLNINGTGALSVVKVQNQTGSTVYSALSAGDLQPNNPVYITKSNDGTRYIMIWVENFARNIYFENGVNDYTNLQTLLPTKANLNNPTFTSNINLTTINSKTPSYAVTPSETVINTGFTANWSGTISHRTNQENQKKLVLALSSTIDIATTGITVYTLAVGQRPLTTVFATIPGLTSGGSVILNAFLLVVIATNGNITLYSVGGTTTNVRGAYATLPDYY